MGMDIHIYLINKDASLVKSLYEGRNRDWFESLLGRGYGDEYQYLRTHPMHDLPDGYILPTEIEKDYDDSVDGNGCFGFSWLYAKDYYEWFYKYRPDKRAGWVTTYEGWALKNKGQIPEDVKLRLDESDIVEDMVFVEYEDEWNPDRSVVDIIEEHKAEKNNDYYIVYYFDC